MKTRCAWANSHELFIPYHDQEWGRPVHDERLLFEMLNLEGAQAGLSWLTILKKRENYRKAFDNFDARKIVKYDAKKRAALLKDAGIVRNKLKINAVIENAKALLQLQKEFGTFDKYLWTFVGGKPLVRRSPMGATSDEAVALSKDLKKRGFRFVGATIIHAFMQAVGLIDDHSPDCFRAKKKS
jgi:DNA-3-methyladenine glycosylase I